MKFGQLIEYNQRNILLQKLFRKRRRETLVELYKSFLNDLGQLRKIVVLKILGNLPSLQNSLNANNC